MDIIMFSLHVAIITLACVLVVCAGHQYGRGNYDRAAALAAFAAFLAA